MKFFKKRDEVEDILQMLWALAQNDGVSLSSYLSRLLPDNPKKTGVDMYKGYILDIYSCPSCGSPVGDEMMIFDYCPRCGKRLK